MYGQSYSKLECMYGANISEYVFFCELLYVIIIISQHKLT